MHAIDGIARGRDGAAQDPGRAAKSEHEHQVQKQAWKTALNSASTAEARVETMSKLEAQQHDAKRARCLLQGQVRQLQAQLADAQEKERPGSNANLVIEGALAASRAKQAELQRQYSLLMRKYTALQSSLLDMQSEPAGEASGAQDRHGSVGEHWPMSAGSSAAALRPHVPTSDGEGMTYQPTSAELARRGSAPGGFAGHLGSKSSPGTRPAAETDC